MHKSLFNCISSTMKMSQAYKACPGDHVMCSHPYRSPPLHGGHYHILLLVSVVSLIWLCTLAEGT